ncbi:unnamed protein product [marine sediment metagenome]|uniref:Gfo/Idh/MocA-like oxidoreductase bacterial type C-terminal domain-containing protein n=1 Tax=marine sediment metagenome TaxID=412755 RepID=X0WJ43_9ZZZZ
MQATGWNRVPVRVPAGRLEGRLGEPGHRSGLVLAWVRSKSALRLAEVMLLGCLAQRVGKKIEWDAANMRATGCPEADKFIRREYRKGWEI